MHLQVVAMQTERVHAWTGWRLGEVEVAVWDDGVVPSLIIVGVQVGR
jgi:hypothetical protein